MEAHVTAASQQYRLREQIEKSQIQHGETARVDIPRVRVATGIGVGPGATVFFCDVEPIRVRRRLESGDDSPIPETFVMEGITFGEPGEYDLKDALVHTNGDIRIYADGKTRVKMRGEGISNRIGRLFTTQVW